MYEFQGGADIVLVACIYRTFEHHVFDYFQSEGLTVTEAREKCDSNAHCTG